MTSMEIRNFTEDDMPLLKEFYQAVAKDRKVVFWWIGQKENWVNVFCAFEDGKMVAKGQVDVINHISEGLPKESRHSIYINLKTLPERETDFDLLNQVYEKLYTRALELKKSLSANYQTNLCVGNFSSEVDNNRYFTEVKGFQQLNTLYTMKRDLTQPIEKTDLLGKGLQSDFWSMNSLEDEQIYLAAESEVWPDAALGEKRLQEYKSNQNWTAIPVWENNVLIASTMAWQDGEIGMIEDVFVKAPWRKQGIARYLLTTALTYLKEKGLTEAELMVDTDNEKALNLYKSVGFEVMEEEKRFFVEL